MSKPYFLLRPSGLFCRFLVPTRMRSHVGSRYIIRALHTSNFDHARLLAAILALALTQVFRQLDKGEIMDLKKVLAGITPGSVSSWGASKMTLPNGMVLENLEITSDEDQARFNTFLTATVAATPTSPPIRMSALLSTCIVDYLAERKSGELSEKNLADYRFVLQRILIGLCGDKAIDTLNVDDINMVVRGLIAWPANATKNPALKDETASRIIQIAALCRFPAIAPRTREKYLDRLRSFFSWAKTCGHWTKENPFAGRRAMSKEKRGQQQKRPFDDADLTNLFDPTLRAHHSAEPHKFWCPLIALYSGARINEIAQLYIENIRQIGTVWTFQFDDSHPDQRLKNAASQRVVPIHRQLLDLGFLEYVNDVKKFDFVRLFPNLPYSEVNGYGDAVGDWFNGRYMRPALKGSKAPRAGISDTKKTFHSFRYVVINRLYGITNKQTLVAEITGHERGNDVLTNIYITPSEAEERASNVNHLEYPFLSHASYEPGKYDGFFRRLKRKL